MVTLGCRAGVEMRSSRSLNMSMKPEKDREMRADFHHFLGFATMPTLHDVQQEQHFAAEMACRFCSFFFQLCLRIAIDIDFNKHQNLFDAPFVFRLGWGIDLAFLTDFWEG